MRRRLILVTTSMLMTGFLVGALTAIHLNAVIEPSRTLSDSQLARIHGRGDCSIPGPPCIDFFYEFDEEWYDDSCLPPLSYGPHDNGCDVKACINTSEESSCGTSDQYQDEKWPVGFEVAGENYDERLDESEIRQCVWSVSCNTSASDSMKSCLSSLSDPCYEPEGSQPHGCAYCSLDSYVAGGDIDKVWPKVEDCPFCEPEGL